MKLFLLPSDELKDYYTNQIRIMNKFDSGFDLVVPKKHIIPSKTFGYKIPLDIRCYPEENQGYMVFPRSSMGTKTPLRVSNSIGLIDSSYEGIITLAVDNLSDNDFEVDYPLRLCQLVAPDLKAIDMEIVPNFEDSIVSELSTNRGSRGVGGFGSTG